MKVYELIEKLKELPQDLDVIRFDCNDDYGWVEKFDVDNHIDIRPIGKLSKELDDEELIDEYGNNPDQEVLIIF